ncbi:MAG: secretin N-terminal domain-containing protein [Puniceicoccales bacterium]
MSSLSVTPHSPILRSWRLFAMLLCLAAPLLHAQQGPQAPGGRGAPPADEAPEMVNTVIMVDMPLDAVLKYLEQLTGKAILRSQSLPAVKINFDSLGPMTRSEAIRAVESLLSLNGIMVTPVGDEFLKAVPASAGTNAQVPQFLLGSPMDMPASQAVYTKFFKLTYLDANSEGKVVAEQLVSQGGQVVIFPKNNAVLVSDSLINLQRIEQVLGDADRPDYQGENVFFFQLKYTKSTDLRQRLEKLTSGNSGLAKYFANNTTFEADERTNQLIVITHPSNEPIIKNLITELDKDVEPVTSSEVFYIKHAQATEIDTLLEEVISGQQSAREKAESASERERRGASAETQANISGGNRDSLAANEAPPPAPNEGITGLIDNLDTRNLQFSDFVTIVADERSNAIVAYGTRSDIAQVRQLIEQIDVLLAQVYIEVIIAEVTLTDDAVSGFNEFNITGSPSLSPVSIIPDALGAGLAASGTAASNSNLDPPIDFTFTLNPDEFALALRTAAENSNIRILSAPNIVTTHNQEANVNVSQSQPIITSTVQNLATGSVAGTTSNDVQYRDIGIQLTVTPLIGSNGIIQMEIEQVVENVVSNTTVNNTEQPIIGKREATSFVSVADGEVIVLAGLQETRFRSSDGKLWLIGDIPLIGDLLNPETESNERRELMIFIRPTVYFGSESAYKHAQKIVQNLDNGDDVDTYLRTNDMSAVTREAREEALEQSKELNEVSGWPHPLSVNRLDNEDESDSDSESSSEEEN